MVTLKFLQQYADERGWELNPVGTHVDRIIAMLNSSGGKCPCRSSKVQCPCPFAADEIEEHGHCTCRLFYRKQHSSPVPTPAEEKTVTVTPNLTVELASLRNQKDALVKIATSSSKCTAEEAELLTGIIHVLDAIQDDIVKSGAATEPEVFGFENNSDS